MYGWSISQKINSQFFDKVKIFFPESIVPALIKFVHSYFAVIYCRRTVFNACCKNESLKHIRVVKPHAIKDDKKFREKSENFHDRG